MSEGCRECKTKLNLTNIVDETLQGLGSVLYMQCEDCGQVNATKTSKTHRSPEKKIVECPIWDINTKAEQVCNTFFLSSFSRIFSPMFSLSKCLHAGNPFKVNMVA